MPILGQSYLQLNNSFIIFAINGEHIQHIILRSSHRYFHISTNGPDWNARNPANT